MTPFPDDLWASVGLGEREDVLAEAKLRLPDIQAFYGAPRGLPDHLAAFCREELPAGRYLVYGAGLHTRALLPMLAKRPDIEVRGILDRLAASLDGFEGLPVLDPAEAVRRPEEHILISHGSYEREMMRSLLSAGVEPRRIIPIYTNPAYHRVCRRFFADRVEPAIPRGIDHVIVTCALLGVVAEEQLARVFPPDRTLHIYAGRPDTTGGIRVFPTIDVHESLDALARILDLVRPKTVYLSTVLYKNFFALFLKERFPDIILIHELYDASLCWPDRDLALMFGLDAETIRLLRLSEFHSGHHADLVVSKRGGPAWEQGVWSRCRAPYRVFFPFLRNPQDQGPPIAESERRDIVYAGFLPSEAFLAQFTNGYTFLPTLRDVCARGSLAADIYNSAHFPGDGDKIYAGYRRDFAQGPVRYFGRLPYEQLLQRMSAYSLGWLCDVQPEPHPDRHVGICNRWTGYLSADLPVLLDSGWTFMAGFVREHGAGIIVDRQDPETILTAIRAHDPQALVDGTRSLRRRLLAWNEDTVQAIEGVVAEQGVGTAAR